MTTAELGIQFRKIVDKVESNGMISVLVLLCLFSIGVFINIHLPGIHMDSVNPDYLAAKILAGDKYINHFPPWDRFPVLGQLYHGVMHTYFGLVFFNVFGMSTFSLRIAHAVFGFGILLITHKILSKSTGSRSFSLLIAGILALDPTFLFAFRTQFYITLSPMLFLLGSFYLLLTMRDVDLASIFRLPRLCLLSGFLAGLSFYGYFIYIFFVPAFVYIVARFSRDLNYPVFRAVLLWLTGFGFGSILYFYGYAVLLLDFGGISEIAKGASGLNITGTPVGIIERPIMSLSHAISSLTGDSQFGLMFSQATPAIYGAIKLIAIVLFTIVSIIILVVRQHSDRILGYVLLLIASFFLSSLYFTARLGSHHMMPLLPLAYIAFGISLHKTVIYSLNTMSGFKYKVTSAALLSLFLLLVVSNIQYQRLFHEKLEATGGVYYYSDALTLLAEEANHTPDPPYYVFGVWGFYGSFAFLTEGKIPHNTALDDWAISRVSCDKDLVFVFWGLSNSEVEDFAKGQGRVSKRRVYYQRDAAVSFTALTVTDRKVCISSPLSSNNN